MRKCWLVLIAMILAPSLGLSPELARNGNRAIESSDSTTAPATQPESQPASRPASQPTTSPATQPSTQPTTAPTSKPASQPTTAEASQQATPPDKPKDKYFAIVGGTLHPVSGRSITGVTVLCKNGRILAIGRDIQLPKETERLDADGFHIYPGLIASDTRGIIGAEPPEETTNVFATAIRLANAAGITTAVVGNSAAKASYGSLDGMLLRKDLFIDIRYRSASDRRTLRESLQNVRKYLRDKEAYDSRKAAGDENAKPPADAPVTGGNAKYLQLIKKEKAAVVSADSRRYLIALCELAEEFGIRIVIRGAMEGWTLPDRLGRAGISVISMPRRLSSRDDRLNQPHGGNIENAAILHRHGVEVGVTSSSPMISLGGLAGRDLQHLAMEAAYAVRGGMSERSAIESITLTAARIHGIDDRVGSIEVGKDADFIICSGPLLDFYTAVEWTVVNGRIVYDKQEETLFAHIRPRTPTTQPAPYTFWPRPFKPRPAPKPGEGGRYGRDPADSR